MYKSDLFDADKADLCEVYMCEPVLALNRRYCSQLLHRLVIRCSKSFCLIQDLAHIALNLSLILNICFEMHAK